MEYLCLIFYSHFTYACELRSPSFEHCKFVNIIPLRDASLQVLLKQGLEMEVYMSCSQCRKDTKHIGACKILQPPQYLIIIANRFDNNGIMTKI